MSLSETYLSRKKLLADNLKSMGVSSVDETDGLTTLINAVLNLEPSIGGLDLDTSLVITTTQEIIGLGESIILTSTLRASYDDITVVDVDLSGVLTGATVKFYNGTTLLGTAITDLNGIATYTYTPSQLGNFTFNAVFEGTENFTNCNSNNMNITVINPPTSLVLEADKPILSYYDNDNCVLTATLYDNNNTPMEGLSVVFKNGDIVLATITTDSGGVAEYTYNSQGVGDVTITVECMNLVQTYELHDIYFYRGQEYSLTKSNESVLNQACDTNVALTLPSNCEISFEIYSTGGASNEEHRLFIQPNSLYVVGTQPSKGLFVQNTGPSNINGQFGYRDSTTKTIGSGFYGFSTNEYHTVKFVKSGTSVICYFDDDQKGSRTINFLDDYTDWNFYFHIWNNGTMKIKNIQIKPLQ